MRFFLSKVSKLRPRSRRFEIFGEVDSLPHQVVADTNIFVDIRTLDGDDLGAADAVGVAVVVVVFAEPIVSGASLIGRNNADENWRQNFGFSSFLNR